MKRPASDKYNLTIAPGVYHVHGFGEVNLSNLTFEQADALFKKGFPYLVLKPKAEMPIAPKVKKITRPSS